MKYLDNYIYSNNKLQKILLPKKFYDFFWAKRLPIILIVKVNALIHLNLFGPIKSISGFSHDTLRGTMVVYLGLPDLTILFKIHMPIVQIMKNHSAMEHARYWPLCLFHSLFRHTAAARAHPSSSLVPHSQGTIACSQHIPQYTS